MYLFFLSILTIFTQPLFGCAACGFMDEKTQSAYFNTAAMLTVTPLILFGLGAWFFYKKTRENKK